MDRIEKFTYNGEEYLLGPDSVTVNNTQTISGEKTFLIVPRIRFSTPYLDNHVSTVGYTKDNFVGLEGNQTIQGNKRFTGNLILKGNPSQNLEAQTKQYVDSVQSNAAGGSNSTLATQTLNGKWVDTTTGFCVQWGNTENTASGNVDISFHTKFEEIYTVVANKSESYYKGDFQVVSFDVNKVRVHVGGTSSLIRYIAVGKVEL